MCDGLCMRSFHYGAHPGTSEIPLEADAWLCNPLGLPKDLAEELKCSSNNFLCPNCWGRVHQCYVCKQEGPADGEGPNAVQR
jgi:hypothetical protein